MKQNFEHLKVGDLVIVDHNAIRKVSRTTPTQIVLTHKNAVGIDIETKYNKASGNRVGDTSVWDRGQITSCDVNDIQALRNRIARERKIGYIHSQIMPMYKNPAHYQLCPVEVLDKICELLKPYEKKENEQPKV